MENFPHVQAWLINTYNIKVFSEWLSACLEWIDQENGGTTLTPEVVKHQVFEQWLTSDLSEIGEPSLPPEVATCDFTELISNYALQILSIVDIGFPLYGQQQKLMGRENANEGVNADRPFLVQPAWEPKQSRMLLLTLTDGHTEVKAIEQQPIRSLHTQLPSGTKCVLSGTVACRRGIVLLTSEENIHLLGGDVDSLTEANTPLVQIQNAMTINREHEGKTARREFSGRFITRGADNPKCMKSQQMKRTNVAAGSSQSRPWNQPSSTQREIKPSTSYRPPQIKPEIKHEPKSQVIKDEWEDDIKYSELLDDDMDFEMESKPLFKTSTATSHHNQSAAPLLKTSTATSHPNQSAAPLFKTSTTPSHHNPVQRLAPSITKPSSSNCVTNNSTVSSTGATLGHPIDTAGVFDDDDDFEMEDIFGNDSTPSWQPGAAVGRNSSEKQAGNVVSQERESVTSINKNCYSPQIPLQADVTRSDVNSRSDSPIFTSPVTPAKKQLANDKPLLQKGHSSDNDQTPRPMFGNQAKKLKIQAKVSDLFSKQPSKCDVTIERDSNCNTAVTTPTDEPEVKDLSALESCSCAIIVRASILTLIEKLCSNNGSHWSLACKINDGKQSMDVDISNTVLTELIGFSSEESIAMRQRFKTEPQVKEIFAEGLSRCQSKLISGRGGCILHVEPAVNNKKGTRPVIVKFTSLQGQAGSVS